MSHAPSRGPLAAALVFAMVQPTVAASWYFWYLAGAGESRAQQAVYAGSKIVQFTFPVVFLGLTVGWPRPGRPHVTGLTWGLGFGLAVAAGMLGLYFGFLRGSVIFLGVAEAVRGKLVELGAATPARYLGLAAFIVLGHSLLEEYYWRWFVFGHLRLLLPLVPAMALSSLAFMSHHVVLLAFYFPGRFWLAALLALGVAIGGAVWAWLFDSIQHLRRARGLSPGGAVYAPWLSHACVDAALFVIGWDLAGLGG